MKRYLDVALERAEADAALALEESRRLAAELDSLLNDLPEKAAHRRQQEGMAPVKLSAGERQLLASLAQDEAEIRAETESSLRKLASAQEVIQAIAFGLSGDISSSSKLLKHYPDSLRALGEEVLEAKSRLLAELQSFLARHPA